MQTRTGRHLFAVLDLASVARLTLACGSQKEFDSLMSALADVLGQRSSGHCGANAVGCPRGRLQAPGLSPNPEAAARAGAAFSTLIWLRPSRVSTQAR